MSETPPPFSKIYQHKYLSANEQSCNSENRENSQRGLKHRHVSTYKLSRDALCVHTNIDNHPAVSVHPSAPQL